MGKPRASRERNPKRSRFDGDVIGTIALFLVHPSWLASAARDGPGATVGWVAAVLVGLLIGWAVASGIAVLVGPFVAVGVGRSLEMVPRLEPLVEPAFVVAAVAAPAIIAAVSLWVLASGNAPR